jgi:hypothetical protein
MPVDNKGQRLSVFKVVARAMRTLALPPEDIPDPGGE